jgi:hypothetical protein
MLLSGRSPGMGSTIMDKDTDIDSAIEQRLAATRSRC